VHVHRGWAGGGSRCRTCFVTHEWQPTAVGGSRSSIIRACHVPAFPVIGGVASAFPRRAGPWASHAEWDTDGGSAVLTTDGVGTSNPLVSSHPHLAGRSSARPRV